jgi:hypothetical protein
MRSLPLLLLAALPLAAQTTTIIDRANQGPAAPPAAADSPAPAAPGADTDAGTQRVAEPRSLPFRIGLTLDQRFAAVSNVFLANNASPDDDTGALVSTTTVALGLDSLPVVLGEGRLAFSAALLWQRNLHGLATSDARIADLDFDQYSLPLAASYRWGRGWEASAGLALGAVYSVNNSPSHEIIYRNLTPSLSLRKITRLSDRLAASLGAGISYSYTWTTRREIPVAPIDLRYRDDRNDRLDLSLDGALHAFLGDWTLSSSLRLARARYLHWQEASFNDQDREDLSASAGLVLFRALGARGSLRLFAGYDLRESSGGIVDYDYESATAGLGASLAFQF